MDGPRLSNGDHTEATPSKVSFSFTPLKTRSSQDLSQKVAPVFAQVPASPSSPIIQPKMFMEQNQVKVIYVEFLLTVILSPSNGLDSEFKGCSVTGFRHARVFRLVLMFGTTTCHLTFNKGTVILNAGYRGGRNFYTDSKIILPHSRSSMNFDTPFQHSKKFYTPLLSFLAWIYYKNLHTKKYNPKKHNLDMK